MTQLTPNSSTKLVLKMVGALWVLWALGTSAHADEPGSGSTFLREQLKQMNDLRASQDLQRAEYYARTGHPDSALFCYELVARRYPGTKFADQAYENAMSLKARDDRIQSTPETTTSSADQKSPEETSPALRDLQRAEFFARTGHSASAYWCFELVRRRYPGTQSADQASEKLKELEKQKSAQNMKGELRR